MMDEKRQRTIYLDPQNDQYIRDRVAEQLRGGHTRASLTSAVNEILDVHREKQGRAK